MAHKSIQIGHFLFQCIHKIWNLLLLLPGVDGAKKTQNLFRRILFTRKTELRRHETNEFSLFTSYPSSIGFFAFIRCLLMFMTPHWPFFVCIPFDLFSFRFEAFIHTNLYGFKLSLQALMYLQQWTMNCAKKKTQKMHSGRYRGWLKMKRAAIYESKSKSTPNSTSKQLFHANPVGVLFLLLVFFFSCQLQNSGRQCALREILYALHDGTKRQSIYILTRLTKLTMLRHSIPFYTLNARSHHTN